MLPNILCEDLCSLNPDVERLTFSVVWRMNENAEIQDEWFGRSVIKSCAKLAYEHAQVIDASIFPLEIEFLFSRKSSMTLTRNTKKTGSQKF